MIRREGDSLLLDGPLTFDTVPEVVDSVPQYWEQGARVIDFSGVTEADSSAVALVLDWLRRAEERKIRLRLANLPSAVQNLAELYGVSELLRPAAN